MVLKELNQILDSNIFALLIYSSKAKMVSCNEIFIKLTDYVAKDILGKPISSLFEGEEKEILLTNSQRRLKGEKFHYEYKQLYIKTKNGSLKPIFAFTNTIEYQGTFAGLIMIIDKTEEESNEMLYKSLLEINKLILTSKNKDTLFMATCDVLVKKAGFSLATIGHINHNTKLYEVDFISAKRQIFSDTFKNLTISVDTSLQEGKGSVSIAYNTKEVAFISNVLNDSRMKAWRKYQKQLMVHSVCSIPISVGNKVEYILVVYSVVSDFFTPKHLNLLEDMQFELSFALQNIQNVKDMTLLIKAINKTHEWAVITDKSGRVLYANKAVSEISGYSKKELIGNNPRVFKSGYHDANFYKNLWETINKGKEFSCRFVNKTKNGSIFYLESIIIPIMHNGKIYRFIDLSRDVTKEVIFSKRLECQSNLYSTLYHLTNLSIKISDKSEYLTQLSHILSKYTNIDIALIIELKDGKLKLKTQHIKNKKHASLPSKIENIFEELYLHNVNINTIPVFKTLEKGNIYMQNDILRESCQPFKELALQYSMGSCCAIPIKQSSKVTMAFVLISNQKNLFDNKLYDLLKTIYKQIEFILNKIEEDKFHKITLKALDTGFEFVVIVDKHFNIVYVNKTVLRLSSYNKEELIGQHHSIFSSKKHTKEFSKKFYKTLESGEIFSGIMTYKIKNGKLLDFITIIVPHKINNSIEYYIGVGKKLTKKESLLKEMDNLLHRDRLTGLLNSNAFIERLRSYLSKETEQNPMAIAIINPISFKNINEAFGFEVGDKILKQIAERLQDNIYEYDVIAKLESDRFGLILKDLAREEDSIVVLSKIISEITKPYEIDDNTIMLYFNIGLSLYPKDSLEVNGLINKAQIALADAKSKGENQIGFFRKDFEDKAYRLIQLKVNLELAIKNWEFVPYYQPYVNRDGKISGAESLIRWRKEGKIVLPLEFITYLEQSNLIIDIENRFLEDVLECIKKIQTNNIKPIPVSVNLSEKSLKQKDMFDNVIYKIRRYGVAPKYVKFEIIERSFLENFNYLKSLMKKFKENGIEFSVDDFGTGYSSLSYLVKLPADYIKIDISFVKTIHLKQTKSVVNSIIFMAKELNMQTIAEGVETVEQFETLKNMGCDYFQGYFFYKPMSPERFYALLEGMPK